MNFVNHVMSIVDAIYGLIKMKINRCVYKNMDVVLSWSTTLLFTLAESPLGP